MSIMGSIQLSAKWLYDIGITDTDKLSEGIYQDLNIVGIDVEDYLYELPCSYESVEEYVEDLKESWMNEDK